MEKTCRTCGINKLLSNFYEGKRCTLGVRPDCKDCTNAKSKQYYSDNREKYQEVRAAWFQREKESLRPARAAYDLAHKEDHKRYSKKWRGLNPDKCRAAYIAYKAKYPDKFRDYEKKSRNKNRIERIIELHKWRTEGGDLTPVQWLWLIDTCGNLCACCGTHESSIDHCYPNKPKLLEVDHILPVSKGGMTTLTNVQPLCTSCNNWKRSKVIDFRSPELIEAVKRQMETNASQNHIAA